MIDKDYQQHYQTLGLSHDADWPQLRKAYKRAAARYHPDRQQAANQAAAAAAFIRANRAYQSLSAYYQSHGELPKTRDTDSKLCSNTNKKHANFTESADSAQAVNEPSFQEIPTKVQLTGRLFPYAKGEVTGFRPASLLRVWGPILAVAISLTAILSVMELLAA